ncbi:MAG: ribonuclease R [Lachnospiraceae bacterium]|nr:ribonuclease R [Lachnospiraceae bacterium]
MTEESLKRRKQMLLDLVNEKSYVPMKAKELAVLLQVSKEERADLDEVLNQLVAAGELSINKRGKYSKPEAAGLVGTFSATAKGFGFVSVEGQEEDIYIRESNTNGALDKDTVQVFLFSEQTGKRREGEIVKILSHHITEVVGLYQKCKNYGFVVPDSTKFSKDIYVQENRSKGAVDGHKVVVKITDYGSKNKNPEGIVKEIIGHVNDPGTDILSIVKEHGLPVEFPDEVLRQVQKIPSEVEEAQKKGRLDLRSWQTVTIDGEDAKDLDDAVTLTKEGERYILGVHIADVTNYVTEGSPLDREALKRGTSVYLVDRVIPMLPHKLSNGICSLNAGVDRLALSCIMTIDAKGTVIDHRIAETVICVDRRMSYTSVNKIIEEQDLAEQEEYQPLVPMFFLMKELADILRQKRKQRGSIDFDFPETKVILDPKGRPLEIKPYERNSATKIIEDFMLITNETIAEDYFWQEMPFVYRTHDTPDAEKIQKLEIFINNFGYGIKNSREGIHPKELQKLLVRIEDSPEEALISRLTLRSMKQAKYTVTNTGHFGLSAKYYCHFTSPIRRYPDLQIHRIIKESLHGGLKEKRIAHYEKILNQVADQSSAMERRADEAERDTVKLKKCEYMSKRIGEVFTGVISGMSAYGFYVELPNTIEGMVHVNSLEDDYYYYDEEKYEMVGKESDYRYKLGQTVHVVVVATDKLKRTIDFEIEKEDEEIEDGKG